MHDCYRNTAKTFYAASIFFEILNQFGALQPDVSFMVLLLSYQSFIFSNF